jgi:hypothetical protein
MLSLLSAPLGFIAPLHLANAPLPTMATSRAPVAIRMVISPPDGFGAVDFGTTASDAAAAADTGDGSVFGSILFVICAVVAFNFAQGFIKGAHAALEDEDSDANAPRPEAKKFGWLQADMRMPLPSWEELQTSCYRVGEHQGHTMYACCAIPKHVTSTCASSSRSR